MRLSIWKCVTAGCVAVAAACGDPAGTGETAGDPEALARAQELWNAQEIDDYRMTVRLQGGMIAGGARITVSNGVPVSVHPLLPGEVVPPGAFEHLDTVEELFEVLVAAHDDDAHRIDVEYHAQLGVPVDVYIDPEKNTADEEHGFIVELFEIL